MILIWSRIRNSPGQGHVTLPDLATTTFWWHILLFACINYLCVSPSPPAHIRTNACRNSSCGTLHNSICVINWQLTGAAIKISGHKIQLWPQQVHKQNTHAHIHTPAHAHMPHKIDTHPTHAYKQFSRSQLHTQSMQSIVHASMRPPCGIALQQRWTPGLTSATLAIL